MFDIIISKSNVQFLIYNMKKFISIKIQDSNSSLTELLKKMIDQKDKDFVYDADTSERVNQDCKNDPICKGNLYAVFKTKLDSLYKTYVYISIKGDELDVFNITSQDPRYSRLNVTQYNFVMNFFFHHFMARFLDSSFSNKVFFSGEDQKMIDLIGENAYNALVQWEKTCNKDNPISHPMDEDKWFYFICELYKSGKNLHPSDLEKWLTEDCNWSSFYNEVISQIANELEYSLELLKYYGEYNSK